MDTTMVTETMMSALEKLDGYVDSGEIRDSSQIASVMVIVTCDSPTSPDDLEDDEYAFSTQTQTFLFVNPDDVRTMMGTLALANKNTTGSD